jgi:cytochrome P450
MSMGTLFLSRLMRLCVRDVQYGNVRIEKGKLVLIPLLAMQQDPTEYPNPSQFDPDRYVHVRPHNIFILYVTVTHTPVLCFSVVRGGIR